MLKEKLPSGSKILDKLLGGGYDKDVVTAIYGPAGAGKTCLCMLCSIGVARSGKRVIYVDTEQGFSVERLQQICGETRTDPHNILSKMLFLSPTTFEEQVVAFDKVKNSVTDDVGLIVVDTIAMLYRLELGQTDDVKEVNRELSRQLSFLTKIARTKDIPVLVVNQVYADFESKDQVKMVGGDIVKYGAKGLVELQITQAGNRKAVLRKHRAAAEQQEITFKIVQGGILGTTEQKKFGLFSR